MIKVILPRCTESADQLSGYKNDMMSLHQNLNNVKHLLQGGICSVFSPDSLVRVGNQMQEMEERMEAFANALREVMAYYEQTERELHGEALTSVSEDAGKGYKVDSILFDDEGAYGGNQGSLESIYDWDPIRCWELLGWLREYYPSMSLFAAFSYFSSLNHSGCSYVALANTLFMVYEGRPEEFEQRFGFPMYRDGDLNYDRLILDIYARSDFAGRFDGNNGLPEGPTLDTIQDLYENYLNDRGIQSDIEFRRQLTAAEFQVNAENGRSVVLLIFHKNMYDANGNSFYIDGGHAVTVTGVTEDGRYIVSSWGREYYVNPAELGADGTYMLLNHNV